MIFPPEAESRTIVSSFIWTKHRNVSEGQTDGQICRLHWEQCGRTVKNYSMISE